MGEEAQGEYKGYTYTIDSNFHVTIEGKISGIRPIVTITKTQIGSTSATIHLEASITEGDISSITKINTDSSKTEEAVSGSSVTRDYSVTYNGTYRFIVIGSNGSKKTVSIEITNIADTVLPTIHEISVKKENNKLVITVDATDDDPRGIALYKYTVNGNEYVLDSKQNSCEFSLPNTSTNLGEGTRNKKESSRTKPYVPEGFYYSHGTVDTGYVITDDPNGKLYSVQIEVLDYANNCVSQTKSLQSGGNQFVWIPIGDRIERIDWGNCYGGNFSMYTDLKDDKFYSSDMVKYSDMEQSVLAYHGFYFSCYEVSKNEQGRLTSTGDTPVTYVTSVAIKEAKKMYLGINDHVTSHLVWGCEWDAALNFIGNGSWNTSPAKNIYGLPNGSEITQESHVSYTWR